MRIALVTDSFLPSVGGAEMVVHHLASRWFAQGHEVCVFNSHSGQPTHPEARYAVRRYTLWRGATRFGHHRFPWFLASLRSLRRLLDSFQPDFVSGHFAYPVALYLARLRPAGGFIITAHGADLERGFPDSIRDRHGVDGLLRRSLAAADAAVAISPEAHRAFAELGVPPDRIADIPNGVEVQRFVQRGSFPLRARLDLPPDAPLLLAVGRNEPPKNLEMAIQVLAHLTKEFPSLYLLLIGRGTAGLRGSIDQAGVASRVILRDETVGEELVAAFQQASVLLSTSLRESCPLVILEAMAAGLPQVALDVPGNRHLVESGTTGFLVRPENPAGMAEVVAGILRSPSLRSTLRAANQARSSRYDWGRISREYLQLAARSKQDSRSRDSDVAQESTALS